MSKDNGLQLHSVGTRYVINWIYKNKISKFRIKDLCVKYSSKSRPNHLEYVLDNPIDVRRAVMLVAELVSRGLVDARVGDTNVEYFYPLFDGNKDKEWHLLARRRSIFAFLRDGIFWLGKNFWLVLVWVATVFASTVAKEVIQKMLS